MCFHWKSLLKTNKNRRCMLNKFLILRQMNIIPLENMKAELVLGHLIKAQKFQIEKSLQSRLENFKSKYPEQNNVPRPKHWSGWRLKPRSIEFWLDGEFRIHERLKYIKEDKEKLEKDFIISLKISF